MSDNTSLFNTLTPVYDETQANNSLDAISGNPFDRVMLARQQRAAEVEQATQKSIESLSRHRNRYQEQQSLAGKAASLGTDSDTVRTLTGGVARGVGSVADGFGRLADLVPGPSLAAEPLKVLGAALQEIGDYAKGTVSTRTERAIEDTAITGDFFDPSSWDFGADPNVTGYAHQLLGILGEFAPQAAGLLAKSPKVAQGIMGVIGFAQAGSGQAQEAADYIAGLDDAALFENVELAQTLREANPDMSVEDIRNEVSRVSEAASFIAGGTVGGAGGVLTGKILRPVQQRLSGNFAGRVTKTVGLSGVEEATQELGESVMGRVATNMAVGTDRDLTEDTLGDVVLGGSFGGSIGVPATVAEEVRRQLDSSNEKAAERRANATQENQAIVSAIQEGRFEDLTKPENQEQYPRRVSAQALSKVAADEAVDPVVRKQAIDTLATIQEQVAAELTEVKAPEVRQSLKEEQASTKKKLSFLEKRLAKQEQDGADAEAIQKTTAAIETVRTQLTDIETQLVESDPSNNKQVKQLQEELTSITELRKNAVVEQLRDVDVEGLMTATKAPESTPEVRQASARQLVKVAMVNTDVLTSEQAKELSSSNQLGLSSDERRFLRKLSEAKVQENILKNMDTVGRDIFSDQPSRGYISLSKYRSLIEGAMQRNDREAAERSLAMLERFNEDHKAKAKGVRKAYQTAQQSGKQQALISKNGSWATEAVGNIWDKVTLRQNGGLAIHTGSKKLVDQIVAESKAIDSTLQALRYAVKGVEGTNAQTTGAVTESTETTTQATNNPDERTSTPVGTQTTEGSENPASNSAEVNADAQQSENQTNEQAEAQSPQAAERTKSDVPETTDGNAEPTETGSNEEVSTRKLQGSVMKGRFPETMSQDVLERTTQKVTQRFGELQQAISRGAENNGEIDLLRQDLRLLADIRLADADPAIKELFEMLVADNNGAELTQVIDWAKKHGTKTHATVLDKLLQHQDVQKIDTVTLLTETEKDQNGVYKPFGMYFRDRETLGFDPFALTDTKAVDFAVDVVTHEIMHAATYNEVDRNEGFRTEIQQISEEIGTWLQDEKNRGLLDKQNLSALEYAINDPQELLATVFGSPSIMADLEKIPSPRYGTAFNRFVTAIIDSVKTLFNINPAEANMLERVLMLGEAVVEAGITEETRTDTGPVYTMFKQGQERIDGQMTQEQIQSVNKIPAYFTPSGRTALSKEPDFFTNVLSRAKEDPVLLSGFVRGGQERVETLQEKTSGRPYLQTVIDEIADMNGRIDKIFRPTEIKHRWSNPFSYFVNEDGSIDENVKTAISQAAIDFAMANHNDMWFNTTDAQVRAFHGLSDTDIPTNEQRHTAYDAGRRRQSVIQELGRKAYQATGLRLNKTAPLNEEQQIVMAMGEIALGVLYNKGYVQEHQIPNGSFAGTFTVRSNRLKGAKPNPVLENLRQTARGSQNFLDDLFGTEHTKTFPTTAPVKFRQEKAKNSPLAVPKKLAKILDKENRKAHYLKDELVGQTGLFRRIPETLLEKIAGVEEADGRSIHKTRLLGIQGKNDALRREIRILLEDTVEDLLGNDLSQPLYLQHEAWKMHRVGYKSNGFNPQASKVHRYAFKMDGWDYRVDPNNDQGANHKEFKLAILDAFGRKTDEASTENVLKQFDSLMSDDKVIMATDAINALLQNPDITIDNDMDAARVIEEVVAAGKENMHTFAGLIELAKYMEAKRTGTDFVTSLIREGDGKTNGPIISNLQLGMSADLDSQTELMNMGGLFVEGQGTTYESYGHYAEKVGLDLYKRLAKEANDVMGDLLQADKVDQQTYLPVRLLSEVIGNFVDDKGNVSKEGRKAVKQPLTSMIFGAGVNGTIDNMAYDFVEGLYGQFEKHNTNPKAMRGFIRGLNQVMEISAGKQKRRPGKSQYEIPQNIEAMEYEFNDVQIKLLKDTFKEYMGASIRSALTNQFESFLKTRSDMNEAANMAFRFYNLAFQTERNRMKALIEQESGNKYQDLTKEQEDEIHAKLKKLFPATHIAYSKASGESEYTSGLPLLKQKRESFEDNQYRTVTKFNNLNVPGKSKPTREMSGYGIKNVFEEPGAGTVVLSAHGLDTYAAAETYARYNVLNSHDATHAPANLSAETIQQMNKAFFEAMEFSSIPENIMDSLYRGMDEFAAWETEYVQDMDEASLQAWEEKKKELRPMVWKDGKKVRSDKTPEQHASVWLATAASAHRNKLNFLAKLDRVEQYYVDGAAYKVPTKKKEELAKRAAEEDLVKLIMEKRAQRTNTNLSEVMKAQQSTMASTVPTPQRDARQASYRQGSPRQVTNFTTKDVFNALASQDGISPQHSNRLESVLDTLVTGLHGPFGALKAAVEAKAGETPVDLTIRAEQEGAYPFSSRARGAGLGLSKAEAFVVEQVELVVRETLDGKSLADRELVKLYRDTKKTIKPVDLYSGDKQKAQEIYDFIFKVTEGDSRNDHLSRFAALSLVYPPLIQAMDFGASSETTPSGSEFGDRLRDTFNQLVQKASDEINNTYSGQKANERMNVLVQRLVQIEQKRKLEMAKKGSTLLDQVEMATSEAREGTKDLVVKAAQSPLFRDSKYSGVRAVSQLTEILAEDRADELLKNLEGFRNNQFRKKPLGLFMSTLNEIRGETLETSRFFNLLAKAGQIEQERKQLLENTISEVLSRFENGETMTDIEKSAINQVFLRNDLASLYGPMKAEEITTLIRNESRLNQKIQELTKTVLADKQHGGYYMTSVKDLGYFLATGKNVSENLSTNAHQIAHLFGTGVKVDPVKAEQIKGTLDQLATLYALKYTNSDMKTMVDQVITQEMSRGDQSGINFLLQFHKGLKADAQAELFDNNPAMMMKGYTKEIYNPHTEVVAANRVDGAKLEAKGYVKHYDLPKDPADPDAAEPRALYVLADAGLNDYVTGMISNTGMRARGTKVNFGSTVDNPEALKKWKDNRLGYVVNNRKAGVNNMFSYKSDYDPSKRKPGRLAPVYSPQGTVANFRYLMDHNTKDELLERNNRFEYVLGGMVSSQYDKLSSRDQNSMVVSALYDFYKDDYSQNSDAYVEVSLEASEPRLREAYRLLPDATKAEIKRVWGQDKMFVRNDVLDMVMGYRKLSMADVFDRDESTRNVVQNILVDLVEKIWGQKAGVKVRQAEDMWQATVKIVKDVWVIRNLTTFLGNVTSNTTLLLAEGVPVKKIISGHREAVEGLLRYQDTRNQLMKLELDQRTGVGDPDLVAEQVRELRLELERNPVHELIQEGMFQTIMEDIDAQKDDYQYKDKLNRTIDEWTGKLPAPAKKVGEVMTVAHNTTLYKLLFKGTQMSDFVGRYVLFNHLTDTKGPNVPRSEALKKTREYFVNYDVPSHRSLQYGNDMGLVFFTKYYLRIQKVIFGLMRDKPARALGVVAASNYMGGLSNIFESNILGRVGNNPFDVGAANITDLASEPIPLKVLLSFFD
ncbi:hypothetical protein [Marinobacter shengliensis]|uniref:hypothetical protein n=1 Tax=Marinobacter shengliensis TaxID=1389223 RepID=UPI001E613019|nr:hypothetical protein [Marinobacter shengliensis]MCD1628464.1 hypothetical protein [Marinobacter shengliensis]